MLEAYDVTSFSVGGGNLVIQTGSDAIQQICRPKLQLDLNIMEAGQLVETYKFWDVVTLWARERLENDVVVARALARGIVVDGLRFQSIDPRWIKSDRSLSGYPYIGYAAIPDALPILLRAEALEHLLAVVRQAVVPSCDILAVEFVARADFSSWLKVTGQTFPSFWFTDAERKVDRS